MAVPVVFNAHNISALTLPRSVNVSQGDLLTRLGSLAKANEQPAAFISLATDQTGLGATILVCRSGVLYDSDAPYTANALQYLGQFGQLTEASGPTAQLVGVAVANNYASIALAPVDGFPLSPEATLLTEADQADLADLLVALRENPSDFASLGELLEILREIREPIHA